MSKSLGNFFTVRDLLDQGVPGDVIRFVYLSTHYSKPMDWTDTKRREVEARLDRLLPAVTAAIKIGRAPSGVFSDLPKGMQLSLADDLNTSAAIVSLENAAELLIRLQTGDVVPQNASLQDALNVAATQFLSGLDVLGLYDLMLKRRSEREGARHLLDPVHLNFVLTFESARQTKDFSPLDRLKVALIEAGVEVRMSKSGVELLPGPNFDPAKLDALK